MRSPAIPDLISDRLGTAVLRIDGDKTLAICFGDVVCNIEVEFFDVSVNNRFDTEDD